MSLGNAMIQALGGAGSAAAAVSNIPVVVSNTISKKKATLHVDVGDSSMYDSIYQSERVRSAEVRKWSRDDAAKVNSGEKQIVCCVMNTKSNAQFLAYTVEEMKASSIKELYLGLPKDVNNLNLVQEGFQPLTLVLMLQDTAAADTAAADDGVEL